MTIEILPAKNIVWGFFGTMADAAETAWPIAFEQIARATNTSPDAVRAFLDSRHGRHFADEVRSEMVDGHALPLAIERAVKTWSGWRISPATNKQYGIPRTVDYLTGFVVHCGIEAQGEF